VVGGGTLSLAYSFAKAGSVVGILVLALICVATDFSLFAMVSASRRTGQKSYEGVMKAGTWAGVREGRREGGREGGRYRGHRQCDAPLFSLQCFRWPQ
jgi:hypothetical protein